MAFRPHRARAESSERDELAPHYLDKVEVLRRSAARKSPSIGIAVYGGVNNASRVAVITRAIAEWSSLQTITTL